jgi:hypothetical protein
MGRRRPIRTPGSHAAEQLELDESLALRTYIPEPERKHPSRWTDKPPEFKHAVYANRRRTQTDKSKRLQRLRSERVERSFAHVCETGGARRTWLCGIEKVRKRCLIAAMARNLGLVMRALFGMGTPRGLQSEGPADGGLAALVQLAWLVARTLPSAPAAIVTIPTFLSRRAAITTLKGALHENWCNSTGC